MKMRASYVAWLLPLFLTACVPFRQQPKQTPQQLAPQVANLPKPPVSHVELPVEELTLPSVPLDNEAGSILEEAAKSPVRRHRPPARPAQEGAEPQPVPEPENSGVSAIGQLSSPETSNLRRETEESIAATEHGLSHVGRPLGGQEKKVAAQIRAYLKQAREALFTGDVDGASTLAAKARVLLGELTH